MLVSNFSISNFCFCKNNKAYFTIVAHTVPEILHIDSTNIDTLKKTQFSILFALSFYAVLAILLYIALILHTPLKIKREFDNGICQVSEIKNENQESELELKALNK